MTVTRGCEALGLLVGASIIALALPAHAAAQDSLVQSPATEDPAATDPNAPATTATDEAPVDPSTATPADGDGEIVVTGIRASLREAMNIKRNAEGVVDAISAEDMGKFPDSNLAESLQRITGVSIDRSNGEGQYVTVRGFGPEFNLVTLNGRTMPTSTLGDGVSAPSSRAFDFGNLASEGIAAVEVYKTGRAAIPSGGIGSTINIRTTRPLDSPGFKGSVSAKGVYDTSRDGGIRVTPEVSGIVSKTFADGMIGIAISGSYQRRKSVENKADVLYQSWSTIPATGNEWAFGNATPPPEPGSLVQFPIAMGYSTTDIDRTRINGQATLQVRPVDNLTLTADFTHATNKVEADMHRVGLWMGGGASNSSFGPGNPAPPLTWSVNSGNPTDIALEAAKTANKNILNSFGLNARWQPTDRLTIELDGHRSTAKSKPDSPFGSSQSVQAAAFGSVQKRIDFTTYLPQINYTEAAGIDTLDPANYFATGNSFRNALFTDKIVQGQARARYDFDTSFLDSLDFGVSATDNRTRSAFGVYEQPAWGGQGPASDLPDDIFSVVDVPDLFDGLDGADGDVVPAFLAVDTDRLIQIMIDKYGACAGGPDCLAPYDRVDSRVKERTLAPFAQLNNTFDLFGNPAHLFLGLRYEKTKISATARSAVPTNTTWVANNEFGFIYGGDAEFVTQKGNYKEWLPNIDFDMSPLRDVKLRASWSHTIARPNYNQMQGGLQFNELRAPGGFASSGNPGLLPYKSKNIDLSAEWYYGKASYISLGFFNKKVSRFIVNGITNENLAGLRTPIGGPRYLAALAALGPNALTEDVRQYIFDNYPGSTNPTGTNSQGYTTGDIFALPEDPLIDFEVTRPVNGDRTQTLRGLEAAIQHSFWDTGFGTILNYTRVRGGGKFDNTLPPGADQFALTGLSDSANAVLFYDKYGIQARVAYNWRDKFLAGYGSDPFNIEEYGQWDASASYEFRKGMTLFAEAINITGESRRAYSRTTNNVIFVIPGYARYTAGLRINFGEAAARPLPPPPPPLPPPPPPPPPPATQTCADGSVILATDACPAPPPPPPPPPPAPERGN